VAAEGCAVRRARSRGRRAQGKAMRLGCTTPRTRRAHLPHPSRPLRHGAGELFCPRVRLHQCQFSVVVGVCL
jgi:hypothetical protein